MSVDDYDTCAVCDAIVYLDDCEFCSCGQVFCDSECGEVHEQGPNDEDLDLTTCVVCRCEKAPLRGLLQYLIDVSGKSKEELEKEYLAKLGGGK